MLIVIRCGFHDFSFDERRISSMLLISLLVTSTAGQCGHMIDLWLQVAASPIEFTLPPAFLGFVHFRTRTIVSRTARAVRPFNIKQMKCEQWRYPYGEANLCTKFRRG